MWDEFQPKRRTCNNGKRTRKGTIRKQGIISVLHFTCEAFVIVPWLYSILQFKCSIKINVKGKKKRKQNKHKMKKINLHVNHCEKLNEDVRLQHGTILQFFNYSRCWKKSFNRSRVPSNWWSQWCDYNVSDTFHAFRKSLFNLQKL